MPQVDMPGGKGHQCYMCVYTEWHNAPWSTADSDEVRNFCLKPAAGTLAHFQSPQAIPMQLRQAATLLAPSMNYPLQCSKAWHRALLVLFGGCLLVLR